MRFSFLLLLALAIGACTTGNPADTVVADAETSTSIPEAPVETLVDDRELEPVPSTVPVEEIEPVEGTTVVPGRQDGRVRGREVSSIGDQFITDGDTLSVVVHLKLGRLETGCYDEVEWEVEETDEQVAVALYRLRLATPLQGDIYCFDDGLISILSPELAEPVGDREVTFINRPDEVIEPADLRLRLTPSVWPDAWADDLPADEPWNYGLRQQFGPVTVVTHLASSGEARTERELQAFEDQLVVLDDGQEIYVFANDYSIFVEFVDENGWYYQTSADADEATKEQLVEFVNNFEVVGG